MLECLDGTQGLSVLPSNATAGFHLRDACREGLEVEVERRADRKERFGKITAFNMLRPRSSYSFIPLLPF